jgi:hypothetical protein
MEGYGDKHDKIIAIFMFGLVGVFVLLVTLGKREFWPSIITWIISLILAFAATSMLITFLRLIKDEPDEVKKSQRDKFWFERWAFKIIVFVVAAIIFKIVIVLSF